MKPDLIDRLSRPELIVAALLIVYGGVALMLWGLCKAMGVAL